MNLKVLLYLEGHFVCFKIQQKMLHLNKTQSEKIQKNMHNPLVVKSFSFDFVGVTPSAILGGTSYEYQAELVREGHITIPPASRSKEDVAIVEVTGMPVAEIIRWFNHPKNGYWLARAGQVIEIAEVHQEIQRRGRFYALGESWPAGKNSLYVFLDNDNYGVPGRASHIDLLSPDEYANYPLDNGRKAFVAVIGECPRLEQA